MRRAALLALAAGAAAYDHGTCSIYTAGDVYTGEALGFAFESLASTCCYMYNENSCTHSPSGTPTAVPTAAPTSKPTALPTISSYPTAMPTSLPTSAPTSPPSAQRGAE